MKTSGITRITLYLRECYGCDKHNKFGPLRNFIISNQLPLNVLVIKRIELNRKWQEEAKELGKELPIIMIDYTKAYTAMTYDEFLRQLIKPKKPRAKSDKTPLIDMPQDTGESDDGNEEKVE
jgi:hypothetical protein